MHIRIDENSKPISFFGLGGEIHVPGIIRVVDIILILTSGSYHHFQLPLNALMPVFDHYRQRGPILKLEYPVKT